MSQPAFEATTTATFVVRFWREWSAGEPLWRGRIEHVQSGQQAGFRDVEGLLEFLERFGIAGEALRRTMTGRPESGAGGCVNDKADRLIQVGLPAPGSLGDGDDLARRPRPDV